jgi:hypothetical protein
MSKILEVIAVHEAGHACIRLALGLQVSRVWVNETDGTGLTVYDGDTSKPFEHAIACLAGPQAVHFCLPGIDPKYGGGIDFKGARAALARLPGNPDTLWLDAWSRVRELVARHEAAIRLVADVLCTARELSGKRVERLFEAKSRELARLEQWALADYP